MDKQWRVIKQIIDLIIKVVDGVINLRTLDITAVLNDSQEFFPHIIRSRHAAGSYNLTIDLNMLNWADGKQVVDHYKELFGVILNKASISSLTIKMTGLMPTLLGALGAMAEGTESRHYHLIRLKLGDACTFEPGCSPYWEGFGNPFASIIKFGRGTRA